MGDYGDLGTWEAAAENPAAPKGMQQQAQFATDVETQGPNQFNDLGNWTVNEGFSGAARGWYTGQYLMGVDNGWNTGFMAETQKQYDEQQAAALESKDFSKFYDWFDREDATGVVTWNDPTARVDQGGLKVGDIYNDGKKVGNLYEFFSDDPVTANLMLAEHTLDAETKKQIFNDSDRDRWLADEIAKVTEANTSLRTDAEAQQAFTEAVDARQAELQAGAGNEALIGASALGAGAIGAGIGSAVPGVGTAIGFGVGFGVGLFGGILNQDQLTEQTARAMEISSLANKKYGGLEAAMVGLKEFSGVGLRTIQPFSNIVQGGYDAYAGKLGDGKSEFYEVDEDGNRRRPGWLQVADIAATVVDSIAQFGSPLGAGLYIGATTGNVLGSATFASTTGAGWSDYSANFDEYDGAGENFAAAANIGIDVAQLGFAGALVSVGRAGRAAFAGEEAAAATASGSGAGFASAFRSKLPSWAQGPEYASSRTLHGMKFKLDEAGVAVGARPTLGMLVPSEALKWMPVAAKARWRAAAGPGASVGKKGVEAFKPQWMLTPDDFYVAASELASGKGRFAGAVINGWAEGGEEAVQGVLEPMSFSRDFDPHQVIEAYFYGMAGGVGMSLGRVSAPPTSQAMDDYRARHIYRMRTGADLTDEDLAALTPAERARLRATTPEEEESVRETIRAMFEAAQVDRSRTSVVGLLAHADLQASKVAKDLANANPNNDQVMVLGGFGAGAVVAANGGTDVKDYDAHAVVSSAIQAMRNIVDRHHAMDVYFANLPQRVKAEADKLTQLVETGAAQEAIDKQQLVIDALNQEVTENDGLQKMAETIRTELAGIYESFATAETRDDAQAAIDQWNLLVQDAWNREYRDAEGNLFPANLQEFARRSVELEFTRHPIIDGGSFVFLMPQISMALTGDNAHGYGLTHQSILKAMGGDRDGDTMVTQNFVWRDLETLELMRAGKQQLAPVMLGDEVTGYEVVSDPPDGEKLFIEMISEGFSSANSSIVAASEGALLKLQAQFYTRYEGVIENSELIELLHTFIQEVSDGNVEARMNLITGLVNANPDGLLKLGRQNNVMEVPWIQQQISIAWHEATTAIAMNTEVTDFTPSMMEADKLPPEQVLLVTRANEEAVNDGQTMYVLLEGGDPVRLSQKLHYSIFRAAVDAERGDLPPEGVQELIRRYAELGSNISQSALAKVRGRNAVQKRVSYWLQEIAQARAEELGEKQPQALLLLANTRVKDYRFNSKGELEEHEVSLLQMLLHKSLEIEKRSQAATMEHDVEFQRKMARLDRLTRMNAEEGGKSTTAQLAMQEIFGSYPMHELLGDSAKYLGGHRTMNQLVLDLADRTAESRQEQLYRWERKAPYLLNTRMGNPPYTHDEVLSRELSSYRILVDAVAAVAQTAPRDRRTRNAEYVSDLVVSLQGLQAMVAEFAKTNRLKGTGREVLELMLENNLVTAQKLAELFPDAAKLAAFPVVNGKVYPAKWVMEMFEQDPQKAAVTYVVQTKLAEWNQLGGNVRLDDADPEIDEAILEDGGPDRTPKHPKEFKQIKSRILQTFYALAQERDGTQLLRLIRAMNNAPTVAELEKVLNSEPEWVGDRGELLAFFDDVAEFSTDPSEVWTANLPGTIQRDAITAFATHTKIMSKVMAEEAVEQQAERVLLNNMATKLKGGKDRGGAARMLELLELAIANRIKYPDHLGPRVRDQLTIKIQESMIRMHDKGAPDPAIAPFGESLVLVDEFGVKMSTLQAVDALTLYDVEDVLTNPTKLADGPVRVGTRDGSYVVVDLSTKEGALAALRDPATNAFAKEVLFPTVRDINVVGVLQSYRDTNSRGLAKMLEEETLEHLFVPEDGRMSLASAHKLLSMLESGVRKKALAGTEQEQEGAYFAIQQIVNEFIVAYSHRDGVGRMSQSDKDKLRNNLYIDIAQAIFDAAVLKNQDDAKGGDQVTLVKNAIKGVLQQRFLKDSSLIKRLLGDKVDQAILDAGTLEVVGIAYSRRSEEISAQLADPALDDEQRRQLLAEKKLHQDRATAQIEKLEQFQGDSVVESALLMFTMSGNKRVDRERKLAIYRLLTNENRQDRFVGANDDLMQKLQWLVGQKGGIALESKKISTAEWNELGGWAASVYLAELTGRASSAVNLTPLLLGPEGEQQRRFFDFSWGYLLDNLFNPQVLEVAQDLAKTARYAPPLTFDKVAKRIGTSLFNESKLGGWTELVVPESLKARRVLASAAGGLAIPVAGIAPPELAAYDGGTRRTFRVPDATAQTTFTTSWDVEEGSVPLSTDEIFKLNNSFSGRISLKGVGADGQPVELLLLPDVGNAWQGNADVRNAPFKVISVQRLNKEIAKQVEARGLTGTLELEIDYFDVDTKPYSVEWAHNVFYDGVGREETISTAFSLIGEQYFATGGLSKKGQQNPLDLATKKGRGYRATPVIPLDTAIQLEAGDSVAAILREKAKHLVQKDYDLGKLLPGDLRSTYKMLTVRHVVVGLDAQGKKSVMWPDQAIEWETQNPGKSISDPSFPIREARLVPISDSQAQTLLGDPSDRGFPDVTTAARLNLADMDNFVSLDASRLEALGLSNLGDTVTLKDTQFANQQAMQQNSMQLQADRERLTQYEQANRVFRELMAPVRSARAQARKSGFDPKKINKKNRRALDRMLGREGLGPLLARLGVPATDIHDLRENTLSTLLAAKLNELANVNSGSVIWRHVQGGIANPVDGVLTEVSMRDEFSHEQQHQRPVFQDVVVIELDSFLLTQNGKQQEAFEKAQQVIKQYTRQGVTIVLASESGRNSLRADLAEWMSGGSLGYEGLAESAHFFAPIDPKNRANQTRRALESSLTATNHFTGKSIVLTLLSDYFGDGASENVTYGDFRPEQAVWTGEALTLLPTELGTVWGRPVKSEGEANSYAKMSAMLLDFLKSPAGVAHLKQLGGDPKDVPKYRVLKDGMIEPGIRDIEAAAARLIAVLEANHYPTDVGEEIMLGDFIPLVGPGNQVMLARVGFELPKQDVMDEQLHTAVGQKKPVDGEAGAGIVVATDRLQRGWTVRPPAVIDDVQPDANGGLNLLVRYDLSWLGKGISEAEGWKTLYTVMPDDLAGPEEPLSPNGLRINGYTSRKSRVGKQATSNTLTNFRAAFALTGINFEQDMVEFFLGKKTGTSEEVASVRAFLKMIADNKPGWTASELMGWVNEGKFLSIFATELNKFAEESGLGIRVPGLDQPFQRPTPNARLAQLIMASLMAPRIQVEDVLGTRGLVSLTDLKGGAKITHMPAFFTDSLNSTDHPELRSLLINRINAQLPTRADGKKPYFLGEDFQFHVLMQNPQTGEEFQVPRGTLAISLEYPADENSVNYVQAKLRADRQGATQHVAFVTAQTSRGRTETERDISTGLFEDSGVIQFDEDSDPSEWWNMLRDVPRKDTTYRPWSRRNSSQRFWTRGAHVKMVHYLEPIDFRTGEPNGWTASEIATYRADQARFLAELNLPAEYAGELDYLIRQFFGIRGRLPGEPEGVDFVSASVAKQATEMILQNIRRGMIPTYGGIVNLPHEGFMKNVYREQIGKAKPWSLKTTTKGNEVAGSWDEWVAAIFGQFKDSDDQFYTVFRQDLDGFMHTYLNSTDDTYDLPVSTSQLIDLKLMDKETGEFISSLDPNEEVILRDPGLFETVQVTLDALVGQEKVFNEAGLRSAPESTLVERIARVEAWHHKRRLPKDEKKSVRSYVEEGSWYQQSSRDTHSFMHNMVNLSVFTRLLNPALWTSALVEVFVRNTIEETTNLVMGESSSKLGQAISKVGTASGIPPKYSTEELAKIRKLADALGVDNRFLGEIYEELMYQNLIEAGRGKVGVGLEKAARFAAKATSDPTYGMRAKTVARRYLEAALAELDNAGTPIPLDTFIAQMNRDPMWLRDNFGRGTVNPHQVGMNRVAQVRSIKATVSSKVMMGVIDSMTSSSRPSTNIAGHLLKIPFLFTRFNLNALTTMAGLGGFDQMTALMLHGRQNTLLGRITAAMKGEEYNPDEHGRINMADVIEGNELIRPFVRGAITQTGLMAMGLMAGGLGLSGEDEEAKRRRRLATYLGTPLHYDPLKVQNDFRSSEGVFLDFLPGELESMFGVSAVEKNGEMRTSVQPHWIMRQFLSPVVGMERFFETGDIRQIRWGFEDSFSVMPNSVPRLIDEAQVTGQALEDLARESADGELPSDAVDTNRLLITMVGVYEKALFELSFVNAIRNGSDEYDRNPWAMPELLEDGTIKRDRTGVPVNTEGLTTFKDDMGTADTSDDIIRQGYSKRSDFQATLHQYAENNLTAALVMSLFSGEPTLDSSYLRRNMMPKEVKIELPVIEKDRAEALVLAELQSQIIADRTLFPAVTEEEYVKMWRQQAIDTGVRYNETQLREAAKVAVARNSKAEAHGALSILKDGQEVLTKEGALGVLQGLAHGTVELGAASLRGIYIPIEMREELEKEWGEELIQEGIDLGMDESTAKARAKRLWYGNTFEDPNATGLRDILWSDKIPKDGDVRYRQLNTTNTMGPDGLPWATGFERGNWLQALGIPLPMKSVMPANGGLTIDQRGNTVDQTLGINTGMRSLQRVEESWTIEPPTNESFEKALAQDYKPFDKSKGFTPYKRRSYGGGGGYSSGGYANFRNMYTLPEGITPYGNDLRTVNTSNPIIRRSQIRRERVWSERGRLKPWQ